MDLQAARDEADYPDTYPKALRALARLLIAEVERLTSAVAESHKCTVPSSEPEARCSPSGAKAIDQTGPQSGVNMLRDLPAAQSQTRMLVSAEPEAISVAPGPNATDKTSPPCPRKVERDSPLVVSQRRMVPSDSAAATYVPSGLNATW